MSAFLLQENLAELLSNQRLLPAWKARKEYLGVIGHWSHAHDEWTQVWSPK